MSFENILVEKKNAITTVTLNRPHKLNAINMKTLYEFHEALKQIEQDPETKVVVIRGAGRAFCSGWDLTEPSGYKTAEKTLELAQKNFEVWSYMIHMSAPIVAAVHGYAVALGFGLMSSCDIIIATEDAKFGTPEVNWGSSSATWPLPISLGRARAMEFFMLGDMINGKQAEALGIISRAVPESQFEEKVNEITKRLSEMPKITLKLNKAALNEGYGVYKINPLSYAALASALIHSSAEFQSIYEKLLTGDRKEFIKKYGARKSS